jgi:hypothetical protein
MSNTNTDNTVTVNTSNYATSAYTRNCQTYKSTGRSVFAVRARDIGRRLGFTSEQVSNDLGVSTTTLTNFVRNRNRTDRRFDNIISGLSQAAEYRTRTGKVHPSHRALIHAVSNQYSTRVAAALGGISPSTASVWARAEKERISREWAATFLDGIANINTNTSSSNKPRSTRR